MLPRWENVAVQLGMGSGESSPFWQKGFSVSERNRPVAENLLGMSIFIRY